MDIKNDVVNICSALDNVAKMLGKISIIVWIISFASLVFIFDSHLPLVDKLLRGGASGVLFVSAFFIGKGQAAVVDIIARVMRLKF